MLRKCSPAILGIFFWCPFLFIREYYSYKSKKPQQTKATNANKHDNHNARRSTCKKAAQGWMPYAVLFSKYLWTWIQTIVSYLQRSSLPTQYGLFIFSLGTWTAMLSLQYQLPLLCFSYVWASEKKNWHEMQKAQETLVYLLNQWKMNNAVRIIKLMYIKNITHWNINVTSYQITVCFLSATITVLLFYSLWPYGFLDWTSAKSHWELHTTPAWISVKNSTAALIFIVVHLFSNAFYNFHQHQQQKFLLSLLI